MKLVLEYEDLVRLINQKHGPPGRHSFVLRWEKDEKGRLRVECEWGPPLDADLEELEIKIQ